MIIIKNFLSKASGTLNNLLKKYPLTLIITIVLTVFLTIFVGGTLFKSTTIAQITIFGFVWAIGTIFIETLNFKNKKVTIVFYIVTAIIAFVLAKLLQSTYSVFSEHTSRITVGYCLCLVAITMYFITKKEDTTFQEYLLKVFNNIFHSSIIYGILNVGMILIIVIFVELILDGSYGEIILRSQILLLGLFYFPSMLNAITDIKERKASSFIKAVVKYVLMPLVTIAMVIIYIYIAKILIQREMPKNVIFRILAGIFIVAFPVWNMANNFKENKVIYKISSILPYAYLPFILLEIYALGIRIIDFGFTPVRYIGIAFILFQVIVLLFTLLKNKIRLENTFIVLAVIIFMAFITPFNYNTISKLSQKHILVTNLKQGTNFENISSEAKEKVYSSYRYLINNYGEDYIPDYIKNMEDNINEYSHINSNYNRTDYIFFHRYGDELYVKEYSSILPVRMSDSKYNNGSINLYDYNNDYITNVDIRTIVEGSIEANEKTAEYAESYILKYRYVHINDVQTLYITSMNITYDISTDEVISISLSGNLLKK